jgi:two-component system response regulator FixJ
VPYSGQKTILLVDDEAPVRTSISFLLEIAGYRVITAQSGWAAINAASTELVHGALIDVHMPEMNGFDTCAHLRGVARLKGMALKIWFMTGAPNPEVASSAGKLGALGVVTKPFDNEVLLNRIARDLA